MPAAITRGKTAPLRHSILHFSPEQEYCHHRALHASTHWGWLSSHQTRKPERADMTTTLCKMGTKPLRAVNKGMTPLSRRPTRGSHHCARAGLHAAAVQLGLSSMLHAVLL